MEHSDQNRNARTLTCPWWIIGTLLVFVVALALFARGSGTLRIDARATELLQELDGTIFSALADLGNALGESRYAITLVALLIALNAGARRWRELAFLIVLLALRGVGTTLKGVFESPRPTSDVAEIVHAFDGLGFPSGHSMTSSVAAGGIVFLVLRWKDSPKARVMLGAVWFLWVALTAFARIWVGAHWLTDTIGGTLIGALIVLISANLSALIETRLRSDPTTRNEPPLAMHS